MVKRYTLTMAIFTLAFIGTLAVFAENGTDYSNIATNNQVHIQTGNPSRSAIQSNDIFQDQLRQMQQMQNRMSKRINNTFNDPFFKQAAFNSPKMSPPLVANSNYPQIKYFVKDNNYVAQFIVPGMDKKDIKIELKANILTVSGKAEKIEQTTKGQSSSNYSHTNEFTQSIRVPNDADTAKISSDYKNGVLTITMPKNPEKESKSQIIPIN